MLLFAIDAFVALEEQLGLHDVEQAVLQLLTWLKEHLGSGDQVFRFSTHELATLTAQKDAAAVQQLGESLVHEVTRPIFSTTGHEAQLSLTATAYPFSGSEQASAIVAELARKARQLSAKGGRQFASLGPTAQSSLQERELERKATAIRKALAANRLKLAYQSIASLEGDRRQHFDVLMRIIDEDGRELHASEFIASAEKSGQMRALGRWVVQLGRAARAEDAGQARRRAGSLEPVRQTVGGHAQGARLSSPVCRNSCAAGRCAPAS